MGEMVAPDELTGGCTLTMDTVGEPLRGRPVVVLVEAGAISVKGLPPALPALMVRTDTVDDGRSIVLPMPGGRRSAVAVGVADPSAWAAPGARGGGCDAC